MTDQDNGLHIHQGSRIKDVKNILMDSVDKVIQMATGAGSSSPDSCPNQLIENEYPAKGTTVRYLKDQVDILHHGQAKLYIRPLQSGPMGTGKKVRNPVITFSS